MSIQKLHYENLGGILIRREGLLTWRCPLCKAEGQSPEVMRTCPECGSKDATLPGAQPAPSVPDGWKEGVEAAARLIDQKAERYANRFGIDDVGGLSFGQGPHAEIKMDHYTSMIELADEVRAMLAARARMSVPEGWKLVPIEPTPTMVKAGLESSHVLNVHRVLVCYDAMIDAAPEAKP